MPRQLEDAEDADETHHAKNGETLSPAALASVVAAISLAVAADAAATFAIDGRYANRVALGRQTDEVGCDSDDVDDVHGVAKVESFVGTGSESDEEFRTKPENATGFDDEEMSIIESESRGRRRVGSGENAFLGA